MDRKRDWGPRGVAGTQGFEPRYAAPEAAVLPLDDVPIKPKPYFTRPGPANPAQPHSNLGGHDEELVAGEPPAGPVRPGRLGSRLDSPEATGLRQRFRQRHRRRQQVPA